MEIKRSLVSVIIPAFNAQEFVAATLDSILAQTYGKVEIIVVDDGSTDQTAHIVKGYGPPVLYLHQSNSGGCAVPRNTGIEYSTGDFLCFMDADDLMLPERVARQVDFMERHPHIGLVFCDYRNFNADGPYPRSHFQTCPALWRQLRDHRELVLENACILLAQENFGISGTFLIRRNMLKSEPGFEPSLKACEDFHFYYRVARCAPVGVINEVGMMRRLHGNNMCGDPVRMLSEGIRCRTMLHDTEQCLQARAHLNSYIAGCYGSFARYHADRGSYGHALQNDWQALVHHFSWNQFCASSQDILRTLLMAAGLHRAGG